MERQSSQRLRVRAGDRFEVALDEPAATGHQWRVAESTEGVDVVGDRYQPPDRSLGLGAPGKRVIELRATRAGRHRLRLELARPSEARAAAEHRVEVEADDHPE